MAMETNSAKRLKRHVQRVLPSSVSSKTFLVLSPTWCQCVFDEAFVFKLLQKWVDEAGADFFFDAFFKLANDAVAVDRSFIEYR